jgi:multicomponent Na+:H+ antiporter subunit E
MKMFLTNVFLTIIWIMLTMKMTVVNMFFGYFLSYGILWLIYGRQYSGYFNRIPRMLSFLFTFFSQIVTGSIKIAYDIATPKHFMHPGILAVPLTATSDIEITILANIITFTPGTMSLDVSTDRKVLYVYCVYISDEETEVAKIKNGLEKKLLEAIR